MSEKITREIVQKIRALEADAEHGPWIVNRQRDRIGSDWLIADFGHDERPGDVTHLTTDGLHASECRTAGAMSDADLCAILRNECLALCDIAEWALEHGYDDQLMLQKGERE